jgi:antitoxin YefM
MLIENFSKVRANLKAMMDRVVEDRVPLIITRQNGENIVMIAESDWAGMEETIHLLSSPANAERLLAAVRGFERSEGAGEGERHVWPGGEVVAGEASESAVDGALGSVTAGATKVA